jgi:hypothetical protein
VVTPRVADFTPTAKVRSKFPLGFFLIFAASIWLASPAIPVVFTAQIIEELDDGLGTA